MSNDRLQFGWNTHLLANHHSRGHVPGGAANNAQLIKGEKEEEAHQASDGPFPAAAARQEQHVTRRVKNRLSSGAPWIIYYLIVSINHNQIFLNPF